MEMKGNSPLTLLMRQNSNLTWTTLLAVPRRVYDRHQSLCLQHDFRDGQSAIPLDQ